MWILRRFSCYSSFPDFVIHHNRDPQTLLTSASMLLPLLLLIQTFRTFPARFVHIYLLDCVTFIRTVYAIVINICRYKCVFFLFFFYHPAWFLSTFLHARRWTNSVIFKRLPWMQVSLSKCCCVFSPTDTQESAVMSSPLLPSPYKQSLVCTESNFEDICHGESSLVICRNLSFE